MQQPSPCIPAQPLCLEGHLHHLPFHCFNAILIPQEQKSSDIWSAKEPFSPTFWNNRRLYHQSRNMRKGKHSQNTIRANKQTKKKGALHFADQNQDKSTEIYYRPIVRPYPDPSSAAAANKNEASKQLTIAHIQQKTIPQACVEQCTIRGPITVYNLSPMSEATNTCNATKNWSSTLSADCQEIIQKRSYQEASLWFRLKQNSALPFLRHWGPTDVLEGAGILLLVSVSKVAPELLLVHPAAPTDHL